MSECLHSYSYGRGGYCADCGAKQGVNKSAIPRKARELCDAVLSCKATLPIVMEWQEQARELLSLLGEDAK